MNGYIRILLACILVMYGQFAYAQTSKYTWQDFVEEMADDEYAENEAWTETMEELALLAAHPTDINTATREQMAALPFLNDEQIEDIQTYIFLHNGMRSLGELLAIASIDYRTRRFMSLFFTAERWISQRKDTINLKTIFRDARHEVSTRMDIPLYYRVGYSYAPENGGYHGSALYHNMRYQMDSKSRLSLGLVAEKDQGEPFRDNGGWDHYSGYAMVRGLGALRTAVVGDFKMGFGEGLVVNSSFAMGKQSVMKRPSQGLRAKRSMDEVNFFRGAAATMELGKVNLTTWMSYRKRDASLNADGKVETFQTSGLHRTTKELDQKRLVGSTTTGANLSWRGHGVHLGATGYYQHFQRTLDPGTATYREIYPHGKDFGIVGVNYGYTHAQFSLSGETAYSTERGGWATLARASWKIHRRCTLSGSYRFYSYRYYSFYASSISENSNVQNESGGVVRLEANPFGKLRLMMYADFFYNPWPRYTMTHSSQGQDVVVQVEQPIYNNNRLTVRYQLKRKERSDKMQNHNRLRLQYIREQGQYWQLQTSVQLHTMAGRDAGWNIAQRIRYQKGVGRVSAQLCYFNAKAYDTRVFQYEPLMSTMFRIPACYGHGLRLATVGHVMLWKRRLVVEAMYGVMRYFDRQVQSSGMQEIRSPWKNDVSVQLRLRI